MKKNNRTFWKWVLTFSLVFISLLSLSKIANADSNNDTSVNRVENTSDHQVNNQNDADNASSDSFSDNDGENINYQSYNYEQSSGNNNEYSVSGQSNSDCQINSDDHDLNYSQTSNHNNSDSVNSNNDENYQNTSVTDVSLNSNSSSINRNNIPKRAQTDSVKSYSTVSGSRAKIDYSLTDLKNKSLYTYKSNSNVRINVKINVPNTRLNKSSSGNNSVSLTLPPALVVDSSNFSIKDPNAANKVVADVNVSKNRRVIVDFKNYFIRNYPDLSADFNLIARWANSYLSVSKNTPISIKWDNGTITNAVISPKITQGNNVNSSFDSQSPSNAKNNLDSHYIGVNNKANYAIKNEVGSDSFTNSNLYLKYSDRNEERNKKVASSRFKDISNNAKITHLKKENIAKSSKYNKNKSSNSNKNNTNRHIIVEYGNVFANNNGFQLFNSKFSNNQFNNLNQNGVKTDAVAIPTNYLSKNYSYDMVLNAYSLIESTSKLPPNAGLDSIVDPNPHGPSPPPPINEFKSLANNISRNISKA